QPQRFLLRLAGAGVRSVAMVAFFRQDRLDRVIERNRCKWLCVSGWRGFRRDCSRYHERRAVTTCQHPSGKKGQSGAEDKFHRRANKIRENRQIASPPKRV